VSEKYSGNENDDETSEPNITGFSSGASGFDSGYPDSFRGFRQSLLQHSGTVSSLHHDRFLPNPFHFMVHMSFSHDKISPITTCRILNRVMDCNPAGRRRIERPKLRWIDGVLKDIKKVGVKNLWTVVRDTEAEAHVGLQSYLMMMMMIMARSVPCFG
jgi:hypothetical protein